ncbi:MAG: DUF2905 domain-containing protein [Leptospiraceae bacterium]|nr:DUF2905 domain-containing protein [Leptospiraceae bacterium]
MQAAAKYIILSGIVILAIGLLLYFIGDKLNWLGRLHGDVEYESENGRVRIYFPIITMLLLSLLLTFVINILRKWF